MADLTIIKVTTYYAIKLIKDLKKLQNNNNKDKTNIHIVFFFLNICNSHAQNRMFAHRLKHADTLLLARWYSKNIV